MAAVSLCPTDSDWFLVSLIGASFISFLCFFVFSPRMALSILVRALMQRLTTMKSTKKWMMYFSTEICRLCSATFMRKKSTVGIVMNKKLLFAFFVLTGFFSKKLMQVALNRAEADPRISRIRMKTGAFS